MSGGAATEPADRAGADATEHHTSLPGPAEDLIKPVDTPDREQVSYRASPYPDQVLVEDRAFDVVEVRHREEIQWGQGEAGHPGCLGQASRQLLVIAASRSDVHHPRTAPVHPRQFDGMVYQRVEGQVRALTLSISTGSGENGRFEGGHGDSRSGHVRVSPAESTSANSPRTAASRATTDPDARSPTT
jgi:hypothetical protein